MQGSEQAPQVDPQQRPKPSAARTSRPRILLIADVPDWIFARHCRMLQRYLAEDFDFTVIVQDQPYDEEAFDLIYPLEWNLVKPEQIRQPRKYVTGIRSHLGWPELDFFAFIDYLNTHFQRVHVVSKRLYRIFAPFLPQVTYTTHGVDTSFFAPTTRADQSGQQVRLGWAGNRKSAEDKGFHNIIEPLRRLPGVELVFCGYSDKNLSLEEMRRFYDSIDIYVCASVNEGSNNSLLEAAAMARAIITTDNGTVPEYLKNGESAIIVERHLPLFIQAVQSLRDDPARRAALGERARQAVLNGWDWEEKAEAYRDFFHEALKAGNSQSPEPLRLLLVTHGFPPHSLAGTELYTYNLALELRRRGHTVRVLYPEYNPGRPSGEITEETFAEVPVARLNLHPPQNMAQRFNDGEAAKAFGHYLEALDVDVIHFQHLVGLSASALQVCTQRGLPTLLTLHDVWTLCEQTHFLQPDGSFCTGPETVDKCVQCLVARHPQHQLSEHLAQLFYILAQRRQYIKTALSGIDAVLVPTRFLQQTLTRYGLEHPHTILAPLGLPPFPTLPWQPNATGLVRLAFLGNITFTKGVDVAIRAFNLVAPGEARLDLYGAVVDAAYWRRVSADIKPDLRIEYHGAYKPEDLPRILAQTDVAVIPSRAENYPTVVRECLHAGVPVIGPDVGGVPEIIQDGVNGLLFQPGNPEDLADKLRFFIQSPGQIQAFRQRIQPVWTIAEDVTRLEGIYRDVLARKSKVRGAAIAAGSSQAMQATRQAASRTSQGFSLHSDRNMTQSAKGTMEKHPARGDNPVECSIIIPVFNKVELTQQCLMHLAQVTQGVEYEVIVVDNASSDGTREFLASLSGDVQVIRNAQNLGFAKSCNQGARAGRGRYLVFLNNDTVPLAGWLQALVDEVKAHPDVAVVGSKLLYPNDTIQHAGVVFSRTFGTPYHLYNSFPADAPVVNRRREFQAVTAACMLVRREVFEAVGGFDEGYRNGFEDVDLCLKIRERGGRVVYQPKSVLYHLESQTPGRKDHDAANGRRLLQRWEGRWLTDEDTVYVPDGYAIRTIYEDGCPSYRLTALTDREENARWERVAEVERQGQAGNVAAVRSLLAQPDLWPLDPGVLRWAAQLCSRAGVPAYAEAFWRRALTLSATPDVLVALTRIALEKGTLDEAERHLCELISAIPTHGEGWLLRGILAMQRQDFVKATAAFENALHHGDNTRKARKGLGLAAIGLGQMETAWEMFATVLADDIDDAEAIHCLLRAGTALERWQPLVEYLSSYLKLNPGDLSVRFALAGVQIRQGDWGAARENYDLIRLLEPTFVGLDDLARMFERQMPGVSA